MPDEQLPPDDPQEWVRRAKSNLIRSRQRTSGVYLEDLCFDAQQAVEKALKALCIRHHIEFPYTHDLAKLITLLQQAGQAVPSDIREASRLTRFAITTRYPGVAEPVTEEEHEQAVAIAERVVRWAEGLLAS